MEKLLSLLAHFYQLSNQVTLGLSEQEAIDNLKSIALQLMKQERSARAELEKISGSAGFHLPFCRIARNARLLSNDEFMKLISMFVSAGNAAPA